MNVAVLFEVPSLESDFIADTLSKRCAVTRVSYSALDAHLDIVYDVVVGVGPIRHCLLAHRKVLFAFGPIMEHSDFGWDIIAVSSHKAMQLALKRYGYSTKVILTNPPLLDLDAGKRRLIEEHKQPCLLHASTLGPFSRVQDVSRLQGEKIAMRMWSNICPTDTLVEPFSALQFNTAVRAGAIGIYPSRMDGHDIQIRRHLALGGSVVCPKDRYLLGDLADVCIEPGNDAVERALEQKLDSVVSLGMAEEYALEVESIVLGI